MARIFTHAPSKEYDAGWEAIFGKKSQDTDVPEADDASKEDLTEPSSKETQGKPLPGGSVRMPRAKRP